MACIMPDDDGANLPIPNRERNNGGSLEVYQCQHQLNGPHPWRKPILSESDGSDLENQKLVPQGGQDPPPQRSIFRNVGLPIVILSCALGLVTAGLIIVSGLFGSRIASLQDTVDSLSNAPPSVGQDSDSNDGNNDTNTPPTALSATLVPTLSVPGWTYLGCFYDREKPDRLLRDAFADGLHANMTNAVCADVCAERAPRARHFGTQHGTQCFCGTAVGDTLRPAPDWSCSYQCSGRGGMTEFCGGNWILSLWEREEEEGN